MTDPEREHFARQIHDLERRLRRWQLISFVLAALLLVPIIGIGLLGAIAVPRLQLERARTAEMEMRALRDADLAREQAERALQEAEEARQATEKKLAGVDKARE